MSSTKKKTSTLNKIIIFSLGLLFALLAYIFFFQDSDKNEAFLSNLVGDSSEDKVRILFIGNSLTRYDNDPTNQQRIAPTFKCLAALENRSITIKVIANGGAQLSNYAFDSEEYRSYYEDVINSLSKRQYDYIILQDNSQASLDYDNMLNSVKELQKTIAQYQDHATILLYETHAYENDKVDISKEEFYQRNKYSAKHIKKELGIDYIPAGEVFYRLEELLPATKWISDDQLHPTYTGYFALSSSIYYKIFGSLPDCTADDFNLSYFNLSDNQINIIFDTIKSTQKKKGKKQT